NGNISYLERYGTIGTSVQVADFIDQLHYFYAPLSNKLMSVVDDATFKEGFRDGNTLGDDYTYDVNGNMTVDKNKGIVAIEYNYLNLPTEIIFTGGGVYGDNRIRYVYDATGTKLRKTVSNWSGINLDIVASNTLDYAGGYIYKRSSSYDYSSGFPMGYEVDRGLQFFNHPEGYVEPDGSSFDYVYQYKDHLGNVRLSYKDVSTTTTPLLEIIEENNYYPFGLKHKGYNDVVSANVNSVAKKFKYNGK